MTGVESLVVSGIAVQIFKSLWDNSGKFLGIFAKTLDKNTKDLIFKASNQYTKNYEERHGILKVLGMREPVKLESIYTTVQLLDERNIQDFASVEKLEEVYRQSKHRKFESKDCPKQAGIKVANEKKYLMVLGAPGVGKSTFLRKK